MRRDVPAEILSSLRTLGDKLKAQADRLFGADRPLGKPIAAARRAWLRIAPARRIPMEFTLPLILAGIIAGVFLLCLSHPVYKAGLVALNMPSALEKPTEVETAHAAFVGWVEWVMVRGLFAAGCVFFLVAAAVGYFVRKPSAVKFLNITYSIVLVFIGLYTAMQAMTLDDRYDLQGVGRWGYRALQVWCLLPPVAALVFFGRLKRWLQRPEAIVVYHGQENRFRADLAIRKGLNWSFYIHLWLLFILPWVLFSNGGGIADYLVPGGGGGGGAQAVEVIKIQKAKPQKRRTLLVRANSAISFEIPSIDESKVDENVQEITQQTYTATGAGEGGGKGFGKGKGTGGGWAGGSANGVVGFVRIKHDGPGWDDAMDPKIRGDVNFLEALRAISGFKIRDPEAYPIYALKSVRKGRAPPFVYLTGRGDIPVTANEAKILRSYCIEEGGMLWADDGGGDFHRHFRRLMQTVFPDLPLVDIPNDDPIFRVPFIFPNGAPLVFHHGGNRALGVKYNGRWVVFYHPGALIDVWRTGHSGVSDSLVQQAFKMGFNVVYYAFTNYTEMHPQGK